MGGCPIGNTTMAKRAASRREGVLMLTRDDPTRVRLPQTLRREPLLQVNPLYALPSSLLDALPRTAGMWGPEDENLEIEERLAEHCNTYGIVGYSGGAPISYDLLKDPNLRSDIFRDLIDECARRSQRPPLTRRQRATLRRRAAGAIQVQRGYAGWLVTNSTYRSELEELIERWRRQIAQHRLPAAGLTWMAASAPRRKLRAKRDKYLRALADFCVRWRLQGLASLDLPTPLGPHIPVAEPYLLLRHMRVGGFAMFLPDTFPVPSREGLRDAGMVIQAQRTPEHLADWVNIVRREGNPAGGISRYGHVLAIWYCRTVLKSRHPTLLGKNTSAIDAAMADCLAVSADYVRKLRGLIRKRLGHRAP